MKGGQGRGREGKGGGERGLRGQCEIQREGEE